MHVHCECVLCINTKCAKCSSECSAPASSLTPIVLNPVCQCPNNHTPRCYVLCKVLLCYVLSVFCVLFLCLCFFYFLCVCVCVQAVLCVNVCTWYVVCGHCVVELGGGFGARWAMMTGWLARPPMTSVSRIEQRATHLCFFLYLWACKR